jgi:hypothetical protein
MIRADRRERWRPECLRRPIETEAGCERTAWFQSIDTGDGDQSAGKYLVLPSGSGNVRPVCNPCAVDAQIQMSSIWWHAHAPVGVFNGTFDTGGNGGVGSCIIDSRISVRLVVDFGASDPRDAARLHRSLLSLRVVRQLRLDLREQVQPGSSGQPNSAACRAWAAYCGTFAMLRQSPRPS